MDIQNRKFCGGNHGAKRERCPAHNKSCHKCGQQGHYKKKCPGSSKHTTKHRVKAVDLPDSDSDTVLTVSETVKNMSKCVSNTPRKLHPSMKVKDKDISFHLLRCNMQCFASTCIQRVLQ